MGLSSSDRCLSIFHWLLERPRLRGRALCIRFSVVNWVLAWRPFCSHTWRPPWDESFGVIAIYYWLVQMQRIGHFYHLVKEGYERLSLDYSKRTCDSSPLYSFFYSLTCSLGAASSLFFSYVCSVKAVITYSPYFFVINFLLCSPSYFVTSVPPFTKP